MSDAKRVLVIGATGLLGQPVTHRLVEEGLDVRALVRDPARARSVLPRACRLVPGDLRDRSSITIEQFAATLLASGAFPVKRVE